MQNVVYFDGRLEKQQDIALSVCDHGFLYGHGLFETLRVYPEGIFQLEAHLARLRQGTQLLNWPPLPANAEFLAAINGVLAANKLTQAVVRITLSRGEGAIRPDPATCGQPHLLVFANPYVPLPEELYNQGWAITFSPIRRNETSPLCAIKSANYLDNMLARAQAQRSGAQEALLLNTRGQVAEGTMSNLFCVIDHRLVTPDVASGLLAGVTRQVVLTLAKEQGMPVVERSLSPDELLSAQEVFLTSSLLEIMPVLLVERQVIGQRPGPVTNKLRQAYRRAVSRFDY